MNGVNQAFLVGLFFWAGVLSCGCDRDKTSQESRSQRKEARSAALGALAASHGAKLDWPQQVHPSCESDPYDCNLLLTDPPVYSVDVERALVGNQPVAFTACLIDVQSNGGFYRLVLGYPDSEGAAILFDLVATREQAEEILKTRPDFFDSHAVVAQVSSVSRTRMSLHALPESEDTARVEIETANLPFRATGKCLAFKLIPQEAH